MKIVYDHQIFTIQKYGGISRYFFELMNEYELIDGITTNTSLLISNNHYISSKSFTSHFDIFSNYHFKGKEKLFNCINRFNTTLCLNKKNFDIFHPTYYDPYFLDLINNKPFVLTVYDMIHERFSEMFSVFDQTSSNKRRLIERASKIIAISQSTKNDIMTYFGTEESKIEVIYLGNSMFPVKNCIQNIMLPEKYILFVGSRGGYKNFSKFIRSISTLLNNDSSLFVICAGGGSFDSIELETFATLNIENQLIQYNLNDNVLSSLYTNAQLFIFPSLYEGFGIPILESFACECPLICSDTSSFPEVAGDASYYIDPYSEESIIGAVDTVLNSSELKNDLIQKGLNRVKFFSWEETALKTKKIYESII